MGRVVEVGLEYSEILSMQCEETGDHMRLN